MSFNKFLSAFHSRFIVFALLVASLAACQPSDNTQQQTTPEEQAPVAVADTTTPRPAPEFFIIPAQSAKNRVWICDDGYSDIFHIKNDCEVLKGCLGTYRNVTLTRAIDHFGRYNCQVCSKELDHIFDEDLIRAEY